MASTEERLSYLEGGYEHLSTKADLFQFQMQMQAQFDERMGNLQAQFDDRMSRLQTQFDDRISRLQAQFDEKLNRMQIRLVTWTIATVGVATAAIIAFFTFLN